MASQQAIRSLALLSLLLMSVGCASVEIVSGDQLHGQQLAPASEASAHIYTDNWGIYLFKYIPVFTGNLENPGVPRLPVLFTDNVRVDLLVAKVTGEGQRLGATTVADLRTRDRSYWMPWTLIFWLNEFEVSGNALRTLGAKQNP